MKTTVQLLALLFIALLSPWTAQGQQQKNVMLIIMDDLNVSVGPYGNTVVHTPNFDRLASRGVTFLNANCQYPLCNPSRTSFLSGLRPDITGIHDNKNASRLYLGTAVPFLPEYFKINGYYTANFGKIFHGVADDPRCWSTARNIAASLPYSEIRSLTVSSSDPKLMEIKLIEVADADESKLGDYIIATNVIGRLESLTGSTMPWLLAVGFYKPHLPWKAPTKDYDLYFEPRLGTGVTTAEDWLVKDSVPDPVPEPEFPSQNLPRPAYGGRDWTLAVQPADRKRAIAGYYASVTFVDRQLGRILDKMDELNLWENTVVVVMGDHGQHLGEHYVLWSKDKLMPESLRTPLIIVDPALASLPSRGTVCSRPAELIDLYPTLTELCDLPRPHHLAGRSLLPCLENPALPTSSAAFSMKRYPRDLKHKFGRTVQNERWLYVEWQDGREGLQLYDWETDPYQVNNLADNPAYATTRTEMSVLLRQGLPPLAAIDDNASASPGNSVLVDVLRNDVDADAGPAAIQITSVDNPTPSGSSAVVQSGKIEYVPAGGFVGAETFNYTITDGESSATARLTMIVKAPYAANPDTYEVSMEAEDYDASTYSTPSPDGVVHFWTDAYPTEDMSGDGAIQAQPILRRTLNSNSLNDRPRIDYNVTVVKNRNYFIWLRGKKKYPLGGGALQAGIRTPLGTDIAAGTVRLASGFGWRRLPIRMSLSAHSAAHVLSLWMSDDGVIIDKILLLPSGQTAPAGFGPAVTPRATLKLLSAVSRKTHGSAGTFDINLPLAGQPGIECRSGASGHKFVFTFTNTITSGNASVTAGVGNISGNPIISGNTMTVNLTGVTDIQKITVTLSNVTDTASRVLPNTAVSANILLGDTTASRSVNASDIGQTKARSGLSANGTNFRNDTTVSGAINASDIGQVKANSGHSVP